MCVFGSKPFFPCLKLYISPLFLLSEVLYELHYLFSMKVIRLARLVLLECLCVLELFENHRIFSIYSLIYLIPFVYIILIPFTLYLISFLFHSFVYI